jgi:pyridoxine 4-dehydrogenase
VAAQITPSQLPDGHIGFGAMRITGQGCGVPPGMRARRSRCSGGRGSGRHLYRHRRLLWPVWPGVSETLIAKALHPYPAELVVATKGGLTRPGADRWVADCRADHLRRACADSLRRLRLERIALYQLHAVDHRVPIEGSIGALVDLQKEGKIHHIGVSNVSQRELARAGASPQSSRFRTATISATGHPTG